MNEQHIHHRDEDEDMEIAQQRVADAKSIGAVLPAVTDDIYPPEERTRIAILRKGYIRQIASQGEWGGTLQEWKELESNTEKYINHLTPNP
jgi:hypothetical protein